MLWPDHYLRRRALDAHLEQVGHGHLCHARHCRASPALLPLLSLSVELMSAKRTVVRCPRRRRLVVLERQRQCLPCRQSDPLRRLLHPGAFSPHRPSSAPETDESTLFPRRRSSDSASLPSLPASVSLHLLLPPPQLTVRTNPHLQRRPHARAPRRRPLRPVVALPLHAVRRIGVRPRARHLPHDRVRDRPGRRPGLLAQSRGVLCAFSPPSPSLRVRVADGDDDARSTASSSDRSSPPQ